MTKIEIPQPTALFLAGKSSCGKGVIAKLLAKLHPQSHVFGMGEEFRAIEKDPDAPFSDDVRKFVTTHMPCGELAPIKVFKPVFDAAWKRQRDALAASQLAIFDGVARMESQWFHVRDRLTKLWQQPHRVIAVWVERPDEVCMRFWADGRGVSSGRSDDAGGKTVQRRRISVACSAWKNLHDRFVAGKSSADYVRLDLADVKAEHHLSRIVEALALGDHRPTVQADRAAAPPAFFREFSATLVAA